MTRIPTDLYKQILNNMPIICVDVVIAFKGKVLLIKRRSAPEKGSWFVPGGRVLKDEKLKDAALRKCLEETGIKSKDAKMIGTYETIYDDSPFDGIGTHSVNIGFLVKMDSCDVRLDSTSSEYRWIDRIEEGLPDYVKRIIEDSGVF